MRITSFKRNKSFTVFPRRLKLNLPNHVEITVVAFASKLGWNILVLGLVGLTMLVDGLAWWQCELSWMNIKYFSPFSCTYSIPSLIQIYCNNLKYQEGMRTWRSFISLFPLEVESRVFLGENPTIFHTNNEGINPNS